MTTDERDALPCPFCSGKCDPNGWLSIGGISGPECEECGATAATLEDWNRRASAAPQAPSQAQQVSQREPTLGELMREQRNSRIVAGAYPDGNPNAGAVMAQSRQDAAPQPTPQDKRVPAELPECFKRLRETATDPLTRGYSKLSVSTSTALECIREYEALRAKVGEGK